MGCGARSAHAVSVQWLSQARGLKGVDRRPALRCVGNLPVVIVALSLTSRGSRGGDTGAVTCQSGNGAARAPAGRCDIPVPIGLAYFCYDLPIADIADDIGLPDSLPLKRLCLP